MTDTDTKVRPKVIEFTSPDSSTVIYACTWCEMTHRSADRSIVEKCCVCTRCGGKVERMGWTACEPCRAALDAERAAARRAGYLALPTVDHDGPVYVDDTGRWYEDADQARDHLHDDGIDPSTVVAFPGIKTKASTPDIAQLVDEHWGEQFDEDYDPGLPLEVAEVLLAAERLAKEHAPVLWLADTKNRVAL